MSYNDYMYAVDRSDEYLAHYGVKGMKWGVRKAIASGNSRRLARAYLKASRKLARLERRANNGSKYARRAAALGAGAAAAGGLAVLGTTNAGRLIKNNAKYAGHATRGAGTAMVRAGQALSRVRPGNSVSGKMIQAGYTLQSKGNNNANKVYKIGHDLTNWGNSNSIGAGAGNLVKQGVSKAHATFGKSKRPIGRFTPQALEADKALKGISNNTIARAGAAAVGAGLAGAAGYNAYRAATTKRAAKQAKQWRKEMNKAFAGTQYANGGRSSSRSGNSGSRKRRRSRRS